jgi:hypothetical protein
MFQDYCVRVFWSRGGRGSWERALGGKGRRARGVVEEPQQVHNRAIYLVSERGQPRRMNLEQLARLSVHHQVLVELQYPRRRAKSTRQIYQAGLCFSLASPLHQQLAAVERRPIVEAE